MTCSINQGKLSSLQGFLPIFELMELARTWVEHLEISQENLEAWRLEAPEDVPLLVWCLKEQKISFKDYAIWAKNHYQLPVIQSEFFSKVELSEDVMEGQGWSPWMVPVGHWDGLTYVGCVLPPPDPEEGYVYLLADPLDLQHLYQQIDVSEVTTVQVDPPTSAPAETAAAVPDLPDLSSMTESPEPTTDQSEPSEEQPQMPDGLIFSPDAGFKFELPTVPDPSSSAPPPFEKALQEQEETPEVYEPPAGMLTPDSKPTEPETMAEPEAQASVASASTAPTENSSSVLPSAVGNKLQGWWKEAQKVFTHAVLVKVDEDSFVPLWKNGEGLAPASLSASQPSLFRIAKRTKKPYHGFVVENEIHNQFFQQIQLHSYPSSLTALTVGPDEDYIVALFGYIGTDNADELNLAESLAQQMFSLLPVRKVTQAA